MTKRNRPTAKPTSDTYAAMQTAYDHFNRDLFGGKLPPCLITLQRQRGAYGYFSSERFHAIASGALRQSPREIPKTDEIAMNPNHIGGRSTEATLSTLAHEMAHLWQHHFGKPSRNGYHNAEWAKKMHAIGLTPTSTGSIGGNETGQKVTHIIVKGGAFQKSCAALLKTGLTITWHDPHADVDGKAKKKKSNTRSKYVCSSCGLAAWAKPAAPLICGECEERMDEEPPEDGD